MGCVFEGVRDFGGFAEEANAPAVPGADKEGGDGGEEDVAGVEMLVGSWSGRRDLQEVGDGNCEWGSGAFSIAELYVPVLVGDLDGSHVW